MQLSEKYTNFNDSKIGKFVVLLRNSSETYRKIIINHDT